MKEKVLVSACLLGIKVRFDGKSKANEELIAGFARYAQAKAKYIAFDCTKNQEEEQELESLYPLRIENFNGSFNI